MAEGAVQEGKTLKELEKNHLLCLEHYTEPKVLPVFTTTVKSVS